MSIEEANNIAYGFLEKLKLSDIAYKRPSSCSDIDIFYIKFIRALMMKEKDIFIVKPFSIISELMYIEKIVININSISEEKRILILDLMDNRLLYEGSQCTIIK